jgi:hypothetical protein
VVRALLILLLFCAPASAQDPDAETEDRLLATVGDKSLPYERRLEAGDRLADRDASPRVVGALARLLEREDREASMIAAWTLFFMGSRAEAAVPALIDATRDPENHWNRGKKVKIDLGGVAEVATTKIGQALKAEGKLLWWAVPYAYRYEGAGLLALFVLVFAAGRRLRRGRLKSNALAQVALIVGVGAGTTLLAGGAANHAVTQEWAVGYLPDAVMTLIPLPIAVIFSAAFPCALATLWMGLPPPQDNPEPDASAETSD